MKSVPHVLGANNSPIIGVFQSCSNKNKVTTSDLKKKQTDSLLLRKYQQKDASDSSYIDSNTEVKQEQSSSFAHWFKCFLDNQITNMTKLVIRIKSNLLVNKFVAKLLDYKFRNGISVLRFKNGDNVITRCLLMDMESVSKLIASSNKRFFGINCHINDNLKFILFKFCNRKFQFSHSHSNIYVPSAPPKDDYYYVKAWH